MKKESRRWLTLRLYMTILVMVELGIIVAVTGLVTWLIGYFDIPYIALPSLAWFLIVSIVLGAALTAFICRWVLNPILRLSPARGQVAKGAFHGRVLEARGGGGRAGVGPPHRRPSLPLPWS